MYRLRVGTSGLNVNNSIDKKYEDLHEAIRAAYDALPDREENLWTIYADEVTDLHMILPAGRYYASIMKE